MRRLRRAEKRILALGRLIDPEADALSDRAIARELGVSQPLVSKCRHQVNEWLDEVFRQGQEDANEAADTVPDDAPRFRRISVDELALEGFDPVAPANPHIHQSLRRCEDQFSAGRALIDFDPFETR